MKDVIYDTELDKIDVAPSPMDLTALLIRCVTSSGNLSICLNEKLINCSASLCNDGVCLIAINIEIIIGAINDTTIAMIAINPMNIVVILAQRGKPHFSNMF